MSTQVPRSRAHVVVLALCVAACLALGLRPRPEPSRAFEEPSADVHAALEEPPWNVLVESPAAR